MNSSFAKWLQHTSENEKFLNLLAKKILGPNAEPIQAHGWTHIDSVEASKIYVIGHMNKRNSRTAMSGNLSFMASCKALIEKDPSYDAQSEIRGVILLHELRRHGLHELNLTMDQACGLINTNVNLDVDEFTSMFPVMVVNFPDELRQIYSEKKQIFPSVAVVHHSPEDGVLIIEFIYHQKDWQKVTTGLLTFYAKKVDNRFETIQDKLDWDETKAVMKPDGNAINAAKLAINSILLAQRVNNLVRIDKGPNDPVQQQFKRTMKGTGNFGKIKQASFWSFQNNLKTFNSQSESKDYEESGRNMRPHWRRGHWRRVAHGEKRAERKWVHFPAVFVNASKFEGTMAQTFTSHTINEENK